MKKQLKQILGVTCLMIASAAVASASSAAAEGAHSPSILQAYFWPVVNFLVLVAVMVFMFKKMDVKGYFRKRTELIEQTLREAREAKELAQKALAEVEERLKVKDAEIADIVASARQSGEKEKAVLVEEGDRLKAKILEQAKTNIDFELKQAREAIKQEAVAIAMELAEEKIREKLTKEDQVKLLEESISKIEGKN